MTSGGAPMLVEHLKRGCLSPEKLSLKIGARVMFTRNDNERQFVNGTTGTVSGFATGTLAPIVKTSSGKLITVEKAEWVVESEGKKLASITQYPLRLAWAITVHKSQGISLDSAVIDLSQAFEYGQGYVALSRVRTLKGLTLLGVNKRAFEVHPEVRNKDTSFRSQSDRVTDHFTKMPDGELADLHSAFIKACRSA
jgi:ATP-dependent exoDNAse (exonuclease V) alpha subunit